MPPNLAHRFNPSACQADFTYTMTPAAIEIEDAGKGKRSVADDLEAVLRKIEYRHQAENDADIFSSDTKTTNGFAERGSANPSNPLP
jgi:hypothetical protein